MSSYGIAPTPDHQFGSNFDKVHHYTAAALHNNKANFSVSHLLDLEELPSENCAMFANTDPSQHGLPTPQGCSPTLNGNIPHPPGSSPEGHHHQPERNNSCKLTLPLFPIPCCIHPYFTQTICRRLHSTLGNPNELGRSQTRAYIKHRWEGRCVRFP